MTKYSEYNIIPIGDHCSISIILKELNLRKKAYPFDWVSNIEQLHDTNIIYNIKIISELKSSENIDDIIKKYIGNAFNNDKKINSTNNIWFPHESNNITDNFEKYKRRFIRLKEDLNQKNIFILLTRHYYIKKSIFDKIVNQLLSYNSDSIILFISGTNHTYFDRIQYRNVIFKYINYDISQFYKFDYTTFRPNIKNYLSNFFL
jgi:hypothetical protein